VPDACLSPMAAGGVPDTYSETVEGARHIFRNAANASGEARMQAPSGAGRLLGPMAAVGCWRVHNYFRRCDTGMRPPPRSFLLVPLERVGRTILILRGRKVILDSELAACMVRRPSVEQAKRNAERFRRVEESSEVYQEDLTASATIYATSSLTPWAALSKAPHQRHYLRARCCPRSGRRRKRQRSRRLRLAHIHLFTAPV